MTLKGFTCANKIHLQVDFRHFYVIHTQVTHVNFNGITYSNKTQVDFHFRVNFTQVTFVNLTSFIGARKFC